MFFGDSFFFPFDNKDQTASTPDMGVYVPLQEKMLARWKKQEGMEGLPADLAGYEDFVRRTMADNQKHGGVAIKYEAAYFRSLHFSRPTAGSRGSPIHQVSRGRRALRRRIPRFPGLHISATWSGKPASCICRCISIPRGHR